eukprot:3884-Heterococcus_DN1.PRE.2
MSQEHQHSVHTGVCTLYSTTGTSVHACTAGYVRGLIRSRVDCALTVKARLESAAAFVGHSAWLSVHNRTRAQLQQRSLASVAQM